MALVIVSMFSLFLTLSCSSWVSCLVFLRSFHSKQGSEKNDFGYFFFLMFLSSAKVERHHFGTGEKFWCLLTHLVSASAAASILRKSGRMGEKTKKKRKKKKTKTGKMKNSRSVLQIYKNHEFFFISVAY